MKKADQLNMMIFMCALQRYAIKYGEMIIPHEDFDSFLQDKVNAICVAPTKGGVKVFNKVTKRKTRK